MKCFLRTVDGAAIVMSSLGRLRGEPSSAATRLAVSAALASKITRQSKLSGAARHV